MTYALNFTNTWEKSYKKLDKMTKERIENVLLTLMETPYSGKSLVGNLKGLWSFRIGDFNSYDWIEKKYL